MSARVISLMSSSKLVCGFQPRSRSALEASPIRWSTSAGPHERGIDRHVLLELAETGLVERDLAALAHRVGLAGRDHVVLGVVSLEHQPHRFDVVLRVAPVAFGVEVAEAQLFDDRPSLIAAACQVILRVTNSSPRRGALVVEEDPGGRMQPVGLAVVDGDEVPVRLRDAVGRARDRRASLSVWGTSRTLPNISLDEAW